MNRQRTRDPGRQAGHWTPGEGDHARTTKSVARAAAGLALT
jgi:hypothetical protein